MMLSTSVCIIFVTTYKHALNDNFAPSPPLFCRKALRLIQTTTRYTLTLGTWSQMRGTTRKQLPCMPGLSPNPHSKNK